MLLRFPVWFLGVAGCVAKTTVAPFDRVKILLQAHHQHYKHLGVLSAIIAIQKREGIRGLFKGNSAQMIRIFPYAAIQFTSYEFYKSLAANTIGPGHLARLIPGSLAGLTAVLFTYPLDIIRARLAFQGSEAKLYKGIYHALTCMISEGAGIQGFYRGITATILGMVPYAGLSFYCFETLKTQILTQAPEIFGTDNPNKENSKVLSIPAKLMCGAISGAFAQTVSYPLDVARRKMQLAIMYPPDEQYLFRSCSSTLKYVYVKYGVVNGLYRGLTVNYMKAAPMVAVSFSTYEVMKQFLGLDTAIST